MHGGGVSIRQDGGHNHTIKAPPLFHITHMRGGQNKGIGLRTLTIILTFLDPCIYAPVDGYLSPTSFSLIQVPQLFKVMLPA